MSASRKPTASSNTCLFQGFESVQQLQTAVPTIAPMPAVSPIAKAPQNVTLIIALATLAPPALAPIAPRSARKHSEAAETIATSIEAGDTTAMSKGIAAPTENVAADVSAA